MTFYDVLETLNPNCKNIAVTVIEGKHAGEKALFSNGKLIWESQHNGFFSRKEDLVKEADSGLLETEGQKLYCELLGSQKKLVICGGGHVSIPIIKIGKMIGFQTIVLEDRPKFADAARRAGATEVICQPFREGLSQIEGDADTFFVIVTRGHRYDQVCLESIAEKSNAYIGMIGSKLRIKKVKEAVIEQGADPQVIAHVYTPIGLDIGAETPEEIGVAIMAEIIDVKNKRKSACGYPKELMKAIQSQDEYKKHKILATIVSRRGSAPRGIGTKMLVFPDGSCVGTIGGGCVEADIFQKALFMLRSSDSKSKLCHVDMTGRDAEEEGMVCGGVIDVFLEWI